MICKLIESANILYIFYAITKYMDNLQHGNILFEQRENEVKKLPLDRNGRRPSDKDIECGKKRFSKIPRKREQNGRRVIRRAQRTEQEVLKIYRENIARRSKLSISD